MTPSFVRTRFTVTNASNVSPTLSSPLSDVFSTTDALYLRRLHGCQQYPLNSIMSSLFRMHCPRRMHNTPGKCYQAQELIPEYHATPCLASRGRVRDAVRSSPSSVLEEYAPRLRILHSMMPSLFRMHCQRRMHNTTGKCL